MAEASGDRLAAKLTEQLSEKEKELVAAKARNYDLLKKVEQLEAEIEALKASGKEHSEKKKVHKRKGKKASPAKTLKPAAAAEAPVSSATTTLQIPPASSNLSSGSQSSLIKAALGEDATTYDEEKLYTEIAERFPQLAFSTVWNAEKKFIQADVNGDGTIDQQELEKLLDSSGILFTAAQISEIMASIDANKSEGIDFLECLQILDRLQQHRRTSVPAHLAQQRTSVCTVQ